MNHVILKKWAQGAIVAPLVARNSTDSAQIITCDCVCRYYYCQDLLVPGLLVTGPAELITVAR